MRKIIFILCSIFLATGAQAQQTFTLEEAISYAIQNNLTLKQDRMDIKDADEQIRGFRASGLPQLRGNAQWQHFLAIPTQILPAGSFMEGNPDLGIPPNPPEDLEVQFGTKNNISAGVELNQLLFDGSFFVGLRAMRMYRDLVQKQIAYSETEVRNNVTQAYLAVLIAIINNEILEKNISNLERAYTETEALFSNGFVERLDVDRIELSLQNLQIEAENVSRMLQLSFNILKFQMGYPMHQDIAVADEMDLLLQEALISDAILEETFNPTLRPEYGVLEKSIEMQSVNVDQFRMGYYPTLNGFANYSQSLQGNDLSESRWFPTSVAGISLSVPIFDGFGRSANIQRARVDLDKAKMQKDAFTEMASMEVSNARISYQNARQSVQSRERSMELAERIFDTTQIKYREGVGSSLEVTQAESELYNAQANYINSLFDLLTATNDLKKALGKL